MFKRCLLILLVGVDAQYHAGGMTGNLRSNSESRVEVLSRVRVEHKELSDHKNRLLEVLQSISRVLEGSENELGTEETSERISDETSERISDETADNEDPVVGGTGAVVKTEDPVVGGTGNVFKTAGSADPVKALATLRQEKLEEKPKAVCGLFQISAGMIIPRSDGTKKFIRNCNSLPSEGPAEDCFFGFRTCNKEGLKKGTCREDLMPVPNGLFYHNTDRSVEMADQMGVPYVPCEQGDDNCEFIQLFRGYVDKESGCIKNTPKIIPDFRRKAGTAGGPATAIFGRHVTTCEPSESLIKQIVANKETPKDSLAHTGEPFIMNGRGELTMETIEEGKGLTLSDLDDDGELKHPLTGGMFCSEKNEAKSFPLRKQTGSRALAIEEDSESFDLHK